MVKLIGVIAIKEKSNTPIIKQGYSEYPLRSEEINLPDNQLCADARRYVGCKVNFNLVNGTHNLDPININILNTSKGPTEESLSRLVNKFK